MSARKRRASVEPLKRALPSQFGRSDCWEESGARACQDSENVRVSLGCDLACYGLLG